MGGFGSGRGGRFAPKVDEFHKVDLSDFKEDWFRRGYVGTLQWSLGGQTTGSIGYRLSPESMRLVYSTTGQGKTRHIDEEIQCTFTDQPFGGKRRWIACKSCGARCRVLYGGTLFRCRQCYSATYPSQYEPIYVRGLNQTMRVREKLGGEPGLAYPFPRKPKGMHWRTYRRLERADWAAVIRMEEALTSRW
ncbi:hypothetical protein WNY37_05135 [Henriciella sp. AS95]|uniref:hypothetical protein n=1 Tax=Henriciella sp. AS95 TaxID=3135782 RepID=UPI003179E74A